MDTWSEEYRHQCLVRYVIRWRIKDRKAALKFLADWEKRHKDKRLEEDVRRQWFRGSRGKHNDWRLI
jgi:hypothetical protein